LTLLRKSLNTKKKKNEIIEEDRGERQREEQRDR
jgi:hypothetical protein